jgi:hypothetical protein
VQDVVDIWPENQLAYEFMAGLGTRWNFVVGGKHLLATGLRWEAIYPLMDRLDLDSERWHDLRWALEVMEPAALRYMNDRAD